MKIKLTDRLSTLPIDILSHVLSYSNPYKDYFTTHVIQNRSIWKSTWLRYFHELQDNSEIFAMAYIINNLLDICDENLQDMGIVTNYGAREFAEWRYGYYHCTVAQIKNDKEWKVYFPTDVFFRLTELGDKIFVTAYVEEPVKGGGYTGVLGSNGICFHGVIVEKDHLFHIGNGVNHYNLYEHVISNDQYKLYRYFCFGRPEPLVIRT